MAETALHTKILLIAGGLLVLLVIIIPFALHVAGVDLIRFNSSNASETPNIQQTSLLRSTDSGRTWTNAAVSENSDIGFPTTILSFTFHPTQQNTIFIGAQKNGIFKTENTGKSWKKIVDNNSVLDPKSDVYKIIVSRKDPNIMYVAVFQGNRGRILKSENGGRTFKEIYFMPREGIPVFDVFAEPENFNHVIIITGERGMIESSNGGSTWRVMRWFDEPIQRLYVSPLYPEKMYLITEKHTILKSTNGGLTWNNITERLERAGNVSGQNAPFTLNPFSFGSSQAEAFTFIISPLDGSTLYVGSAHGLFRSYTEGEWWEKLPILIAPGTLPVTSVSVFPRDEETIFFTAHAELHRTDDAGEHWSVKPFPIQKNIATLLIHPREPATMFAILSP